jgi:hypothetical protein
VSCLRKLAKISRTATQFGHEARNQQQQQQQIKFFFNDAINLELIKWKRKVEMFTGLPDIFFCTKVHISNSALLIFFSMKSRIK